jgi:hypothetical protein
MSAGFKSVRLHIRLPAILLSLLAACGGTTGAGTPPTCGSSATSTAPVADGVSVSLVLPSAVAPAGQATYMSVQFTLTKQLPAEYFEAQGAVFNVRMIEIECSSCLAPFTVEPLDLLRYWTAHLYECSVAFPCHPCLYWDPTWLKPARYAVELFREKDPARTLVTEHLR